MLLDVKKSRAELRPARITHRVTEMIEEMEKAEQTPLPVTKRMNGKYVEVGVRNTVGQVRNGAWTWTAFAKDRYTEEQLKVAKTFAESE